MLGRCGRWSAADGKLAAQRFANDARGTLRGGMQRARTGYEAMKPDPNSGADAAQGVRALAQPIAAALSRAAIFLVMTVKPGAENYGVVRSFCVDLCGIDSCGGVSRYRCWPYLHGELRFGGVGPAVRESAACGAASFSGDSLAGSRHAGRYPGRYFVSYSCRATWIFALSWRRRSWTQIGDAVSPLPMKCTAFDILRIAT